MLALLLVWMLVTIASTVALLLLLVVDERQARSRTTVQDTPSAPAQPAAELVLQAA